MRDGRTIKLLWLQHSKIKARDKVRIVKILRIRCVAGKVKIGWYLGIECAIDRWCLRNKI